MLATRPRRLRWTLALVVLALAIPAVVRAAEEFDDLPAGSTHADAAARMADAGITAGCSEDPPRYCPGEDVTRGQMASFLTRGLGRAFSDSSVAALSSASGYSGVPASVTVEAGGTTGGQGLVVLQGNVSVYSDGDVASCPCEVEAFVYRDGGDEPQGPSSWSQLPATKTGSGTVATSLPVSWTVPIDTGTTTTYRLAVFLNDGEPTQVTAEATLTGLYVPFGETSGG